MPFRPVLRVTCLLLPANPLGRLYRRHFCLRYWRICNGNRVTLPHVPHWADLKLTNRRLSCHLGKIIRYDTVTKRNWGVSVSTHPIKFIIEKLLNEDWEPEKGLEVPVVETEKDCVVGIHTFLDVFCWRLLIPVYV